MATELDLRGDTPKLIGEKILDFVLGKQSTQIVVLWPSVNGPKAEPHRHILFVVGMPEGADFSAVQKQLITNGAIPIHRVMAANVDFLMAIEESPEKAAALLAQARSLSVRERAAKRIAWWKIKELATGDLVKQSDEVLRSTQGEPGTAPQCDHCKTTTGTLFHCSRCHVMHYCCKDHQTLAWTAHKPYCMSIDELLISTP